MATWYYTRDGAILGPYSEEAMTELINHGIVTFVTPVWDADTKYEGKEWVYAYDTPLAFHFSYEIETDDLPYQLETDIPPIPLLVSVETPPLQAALEPSAKPMTKSSSPEVTGTKKKLRESPMPIFIFLALFILGLIIGAALSYLNY